jgi:hypothetical protein
MDAALIVDPVCPPLDDVAVIARTGDRRPLLYGGFRLWMNIRSERSTTLGARSSAGFRTRPRRVKTYPRQRWRSPSAGAPAICFGLFGPGVYLPILPGMVLPISLERPTLRIAAPAAAPKRAAT